MISIIDNISFLIEVIGFLFVGSHCSLRVQSEGNINLTQIHGKNQSGVKIQLFVRHTNTEQYSDPRLVIGEGSTENVWSSEEKMSW